MSEKKYRILNAVEINRDVWIVKVEFMKYSDETDGFYNCIIFNLDTGELITTIKTEPIPAMNWVAEKITELRARYVRQTE